jgi:DNA-binding beta-propeller fold protein YncE
LLLGNVLDPEPTRAAPQDSGYHLVNTIHLEGTGGSGQIAIDSATHRLFVVRSTHVAVVDLEQGREIGKVTGTAGARGVVLVPRLGRGFTSNSAVNTVSIFSLRTLRGTADHPETGARPAAIVHDQASGRVFTMNADSNNATAIDAANVAAMGTIPLGGRPGSAVTDGAGRVYVDLQDRNEIAVVDARVLRVVRRWPLAPCTGSTGITCDATHERLFSACRGGTIVAIDTASGRVVTRIPIGHCANVMAYDPGTGLIFAACDDGTLTVVRQESADAYRVADVIRTAPGVHALEVDPSTHRLYLTARDGTAAGDSHRRGGPTDRDPMVLLVYDR